jgi:hypothetical protein
MRMERMIPKPRCVPSQQAQARIDAVERLGRKGRFAVSYLIGHCVPEYESDCRRNSRLLGFTMAQPEKQKVLTGEPVDEEMSRSCS